MSAPAGWHPQPDGRDRYWDGSQWTDQFRPTPVPVEGASRMPSQLAKSQARLAKSKARFRPWMGYVAASFVSLMLGIAIGGAGDNSATAASGLAAAPTVTVRSTSTTTTTATPEVTEEPAAAEPAALSPKDFEITIKTLEKKCFGSAGCNITYRIKPSYVGTAPLPDGTVEVTYRVKGGEDPQTNTFTIEDGEASFDSRENIQTSSSSKKLTAVATDVSVL